MRYETIKEKLYLRENSQFKGHNRVLVQENIDLEQDRINFNLLKVACS